jgi:uncharacterized protein YndB with AHSA1/START domain
MPHRFVLISRWRLQESRASVWQLLADTDNWPTWWPGVCRVQRAASSPIGDVAELHWHSSLPYAVRLRVKTLAAERPHRLESRALDDFQALGTWQLDRGEGGWVDLTYRWEVWLERRWMRALSLLLRPVFEWNHFRVMRAAARGMARQLGCRIKPVSEWSGGRWP